MTPDPALWFTTGLAVAAGVTGLALGLAVLAALGYGAWALLDQVRERLTLRRSRRFIARLAEQSGRHHHLGDVRPVDPDVHRAVLDGSEPIHHGEPR